MQIYLLILFLLLLQYGCYGQGTTATTTSSNSSTITTRTTDNIIRTTMPTITATTFSNATITSTRENTTSDSQTTLSYSPSPTSFVYTHFPAFPIHTGSSSSMMSSARPSQSAPFPDDTIGKYGRLHISKASHHTPHILLSCTILSCILSFYLA